MPQVPPATHVSLVGTTLMNRPPGGDRMGSDKPSSKGAQMTSSTRPTSTRPTAGAARSRGARARSWLVAGPVAAGLLMAGCGGSAKSSTTGSTSSHSPSTRAIATTHTTSTAPAAPAAPVSATSGAVSRTVSATSGGVTASLRAGTHAPKVGAPWPIRFTVTRDGAPVGASVSYEYLFGGQVVAHRSHYTFKGHFSDIFNWPASAVGYPLTFRAVIASGGVTINLDYPVQVGK